MRGRFAEPASWVRAALVDATRSSTTLPEMIAVSEVMVVEDSEVGRALNRGAGKYLDGLDERERAKAAPAQPSG
jgi:hypothetical protein